MDYHFFVDAPLSRTPIWLYKVFLSIHQHGTRGYGHMLKNCKKKIFREKNFFFSKKVGELILLDKITEFHCI